MCGIITYNGLVPVSRVGSIETTVSMLRPIFSVLENRCDSGCKTKVYLIFNSVIKADKRHIQQVLKIIKDILLYFPFTLLLCVLILIRRISPMG